MTVRTSVDSKPAPKDILIRALRPGLELRAAEGEGGMPTMFGHFAVFNRWAEIRSLWEGDFVEQIAPGAFAKTFKDNAKEMRVTLNHGEDPTFGDKPLGPINVLREDKTGAYYEVPLLDTSYNRDLIPALEAGLYGASFRFRVMKETINKEAERSVDNPEGLPERTIQEVRVMEFGPVTFPAYVDATAGVRSLTDDFIVRQLKGDPDRLRELIRLYIPTALPQSGAEATHSEPGSRTVPVEPRFNTKEEWHTWLSKT